MTDESDCDHIYTVIETTITTDGAVDYCVCRSCGAVKTHERALMSAEAAKLLRRQLGDLRDIVVDEFEDLAVRVKEVFTRD